MTRSFAVAGVAVLAACLASWVALAQGQQDAIKGEGSPAAPVLPPIPAASPATSALPQLPPPSGSGVPAVSAVPAAAPLPTVPTPASSPMLPSLPQASPAVPTALPMLPPMQPSLPPVAQPVIPPPPPLPGSSPMPAPKVPGGVPLPPAPPTPVLKPAAPALPGTLPPAPVAPPRGAPAVDDLTPVETKPLIPATPPGTGVTPLPVDEEKPAEATMTNDNPVGRQEPALAIEWVGPPTAKVGVPADYNLIIRSACNSPVHQVVVRVRVPNGVNVAATEPKASTENNILLWELGTLAPKQERNLIVRMIAETRGDLTPQAWVTFTGTSVARIKVREPKLTMKMTGSDKVLVGDAATFSLHVSNPGDGPAEQVKVVANLSDGLEHARGSKVSFEIGTLAAGETRSVQLICGTKAGGAQKCDASAEAEGGLTGRDTATVNVIMPRLDLQMVGPGLRYLDRKALYTIRVTNPGDAPATNVTVGDVVPAGFKVLAASDGGRHDFSTRTVSWFLGEVGPGQTKEVKFEVQAVNVGEHKHKATAIGARGLKAESEMLTRVEGLSALLLEMVDTEDPIEVNGETAYEVRITNTGSKTETDIKIVATIPEKMEYKTSQGPTQGRAEGRTIVFEPIEKLAPRADAIYRIIVKCTDAGTVRFKIQVTSTNLVEPVIKMEATRIYSDAPEQVKGEQ